MTAIEDFPRLNLLVLRSANPAFAVAFYSAVGISFVEEKHGKGPLHFAAMLGSLVLEIYPLKGERATPVRIGFEIPALDRTIETVRNRGARIIREATDSPWGRRAVVEDPDGNQVELTAHASAIVSTTL